MNFVGEKCAACGQTIHEDDEVIVCPECGSPHHRSCYKQSNVCANAVFHETGKKWTRSSEEEEKAPQCCPACGKPVSETDTVCPDCGYPLEKRRQQEINDPFEYISEEGLSADQPYFGFDPEEDMGGATLKEVADFVGTNTLYYLPIFKHMKDTSRKLSFNLSCLVFPPIYFANRRMWGWALISAIVSIIFSLPASVITMLAFLEKYAGTEKIISVIYSHLEIIETLNSYFYVGSWVLSVFFCLFGNRLYYRYVIRSIKRIRERSGGIASESELGSVGGVKPINIIIITLIMMAVSLAAMYGIFSYFRANM